jgi:FkbM family methyltransferase
MISRINVIQRASQSGFAPGEEKIMQITACLPLARCLRALRFLRVLRGWDRVLRLFFHPDRQKKAPLNFDFEGIRYPGSTGYLVDWSAFFNGAYEKPWLEYCLSHLENPGKSIILDIGGNIGHHALWFAAQGCTVNSFEPNAALWPEIERKSAISGLPGSITLHRTAMGATNETRSFMLPEGVNQGTGSFEQQPYNWGGERIEVKISAASDYLDAQGIVHADLIKIDVEGFEKDVIGGLRRFLERCRPVLWIEVSATTPGRRVDIAYLRTCLKGEYRFYRAVPRWPFLTALHFVETEAIPEGPPVDIIALPA